MMGTVDAKPTLFGEVSLELIDDICIADKGEGIVVYTHINAKFQVQPVFVGDSGQVGTLASAIQVPPAQATYPHCPGLMP